MLTALEQAVIAALLDKGGEPYATIREQFAHATVAERSFSGVGFFTEFVLPPDAPVRRDLADITFGEVEADFPGLQNGAGFVLFIRDGAVAMLEGYTYDEPWPTQTDDFTLRKHASRIP